MTDQEMEPWLKVRCKVTFTDGSQCAGTLQATTERGHYALVSPKYIRTGGMMEAVEDFEAVEVSAVVVAAG
jgi:hypothetical protein